MFPFEAAGSVFLGWVVGRNDTAHIFGPAVASQSMRYIHALFFCAVFVTIGSLLGSSEAFRTLSSLSSQSVKTALSASLASGITIFLMTLLHLPASLSQIAIGSIVGTGLASGQLNIESLEKVLVCWGFTPVLGIIITLLLYRPIAWILKMLPLTIFSQDRLIRTGLAAASCYGAYALGANNVAGVTSVFVTSGVLSPLPAVLIGGISIALGALSCRRPAMYTVGSKLIRLDPFSAMIVVFSASLTVHVFAFIGVPVSTSQALTGAILGIGVLKGMQTIKLKTLLMMLFGWLCTPAVAGAFAFFISRI